MCFSITVRVISCYFFFFSSRRRHTRFDCDWSSDVCSSDLCLLAAAGGGDEHGDEGDLAQRFPLLLRDRNGRAREASMRRAPRNTLATLLQIGRASCRERV